MSLPYCKSPCADCPFRKDSMAGWLGEKRMIGILKQPSFVCHKNNSLQCAGHMTIKGDNNAFVRLAKNMRIPLEIRNKEIIFDNEIDCIEHHSFD